MDRNTAAQPYSFSKVKNFFSFKANDKLGILIALLVLIIVSSVFSPSFLKVNNLLNILRQNAMLGIVLIGMTIVIIGGGIDLSVGSTVAICGLVTGYCMHLPPVLTLVAVLATGIAAGMLNGYLVAYQNMEPFIVTLSTQIALRGLCLFLTGGTYISNVKTYSWLNSKIGVVSVSAIILVAMFIIFDAIAVKTIFGRNVFASGGGEIAARLSGIRTKKVRMMTYVISGGMCAIAALINVARLSTAEPLAAEALEVDAIAAALVGGNSLLGGRGSISGAFLGLLVFAVLANFFNLIGLGSSEQQILKGIIIVIAVLISQRQKR
ncbi:ABC transporter permease [Agathobaculum sp. NTUH-O15-33]|uniref:ABC transporter permease n=1 Tax=Agathobaculum sp. NTUH-O15-33 TaxID=3079302 RepID=UPI002958C484|nr:ABC transporter permease [Agathobaculum sp. NTUH-O15-33]WNX83327.1 ABC transporter permease [Agathobaculum sp. NTUH-O15-33]